jgi:hypothetical protein
VNRDTLPRVEPASQSTTKELASILQKWLTLSNSDDSQQEDAGAELNTSRSLSYLEDSSQRTELKDIIKFFFMVQFLQKKGVWQRPGNVESARLLDVAEVVLLKDVVVEEERLLMTPSIVTIIYGRTQLVLSVQ